jgi:hypothetical protein
MDLNWDLLQSKKVDTGGGPEVSIFSAKFTI